MRRRLFFWLDKLKITRTERQAISILLIIFTVSLILNAIIFPSSPFDGEYYSELDARFRMRAALMLQQQQEILARYSGETVQVAGRDTLPADSAAGYATTDIPGSALININTADPSALQQLRGIGAAYARRITEYRKLNGPFKTKNELLNIKGIGEKRLQKIRSSIMLGEGAAAPAVSAVNSVKVEIGDEYEGEDEVQVEDKVKGRRKAEKEVGVKIEGKEKVEIEGKAKIEEGKSKTSTKADEAPFIINVNNAGAETLQKLSGIGPTYARRIVEYRQLNGPFESKEQLLDIKGIGEKRLAKINPFIKLTDQD